MARGHHSYLYTVASIKKIDEIVPHDVRVLNIGCGTGQVNECLKRDDWYGIDISPNSVAVAQRYFKEAKVGDVTERFDYPDGFFDLVLSINTLHHVAEKLDAVFSEIGRVLVPAGTLLAVEPDAQNPKTYLTHHPRSPIRVVPCKDERALYKNDVAALAQKYGFAFEFKPITLTGAQMGCKTPFVIRLLKAPFVFLLELAYHAKAESFLLIAKKNGSLYRPVPRE